MDIAKTIVSWPYFRIAIIAAISCNCLVIGAETFEGIYDTHQKWFIRAEIGFLLFFSAELLVKRLADKEVFWGPKEKWWNYFDFGILVIAAISLLFSLHALSAIRVFRIFGIIKNSEEMRETIAALFYAFKNTRTALLILMVLMFVFALFSSMLLGDVMPDKFGNVILSFYTHFELIALEGFGEASQAMNAKYGLFAGFYFMVYSLLSGLGVASLIGAVFVDSYRMTHPSKSEMELAEQVTTLQESLAQQAEQLSALEAMLEQALSAQKA